MTDATTLREKVLDDVYAIISPEGDRHDAELAVDRIASILEDTGAPAHMRVAAELRGE